MASLGRLNGDNAGQMVKGPPEIEFKKKLSWSQQMGVIVAMLVQAGHEHWIQWVIEVSSHPTKLVES